MRENKKKEGSDDGEAERVRTARRLNDESPRPFPRVLPQIAKILVLPVATPRSSTSATEIWTEAWSSAVIKRLVTLHLRGTYRSTYLPSSFCIARLNPNDAVSERGREKRKEEGRRKKEGGRRKKEEGRRRKEEGGRKRVKRRRVKRREEDTHLVLCFEVYTGESGYVFFLIRSISGTPKFGRIIPPKIRFVFHRPCAKRNARSDSGGVFQRGGGRTTIMHRRRKASRIGGADDSGDAAAAASAAAHVDEGEPAAAAATAPSAVPGGVAFAVKRYRVGPSALPAFSLPGGDASDDEAAPPPPQSSGRRGRSAAAAAPPARRSQRSSTPAPRRSGRSSTNTNTNANTTANTNPTASTVGGSSTLTSTSSPVSARVGALPPGSEIPQQLRCVESARWQPVPLAAGGTTDAAERARLRCVGPDYELDATVRVGQVVQGDLSRAAAAGLLAVHAGAVLDALAHGHGPRFARQPRPRGDHASGEPHPAGAAGEQPRRWLSPPS
jgi:hypothetical protein